MEQYRLAGQGLNQDLYQQGMIEYLLAWLQHTMSGAYQAIMADVARAVCIH